MTQTIASSEGTAIAGTEVSFPPGALAVDTSVTVEEGASIAESVSADFGLGEDVGSTGVAVALDSSAEIDATQPFSIALPMPAGSAAALTGDLSLLVVLYKVKVAATGKVVVGIIPTKDIDTSTGKVRILASYFGVYQAAFMKTAVTDRQETESTTPILTKHEVTALPAVAVTDRRPFVAKPGDTVTLKGSNFRSTMTLALGGKKVGSTTVASDVQASFVVPSTTGFGPLNLTVEQDGVSQKITLFYQGASDFPVSTKPASEICAGEKFYDASGSLKVGTRSCNGPNLSQLTPGNIKSGITIAGVTGTVVPAPADCSSDGQIGCRTTAAFKAANVSSVSAWDLRVGRTLAGVSGFLKTNCRNTVSDSVYNFDFTTSISELDETATTTGLAPDFWDTSDDDSGFSTTAVSGWPAASTCGADTFTDVSTTDGGTTLISCSSSTCIYKDNVTNLQFTAPLSAADIDITDTTDADIDWANAVRACHDSEYGGHAPGAWRLPTQKELMSIYAHGVAAISGAAGWSGKMDTNAYFWTATTNASNTSNAWKVWLKNGDVDNTSPKVDTHKVICVK